MHDPAAEYRNGMTVGGWYAPSRTPGWYAGFWAGMAAGTLRWWLGLLPVPVTVPVPPPARTLPARRP